MKLSSRAYELFQNFTQPGCPVCRLTLVSAHQYLDSVIYEYVNKPATHFAVRASRGFCPNHAWQVQDDIGASALGIAVLYEGVMNHLIKDVGTGKVNQASNALKPKGPCPACEHQATAEAHLLRNLLEHLDQDEFADAFSKSAGLCVPHLRQALDQSGSNPAKIRLIALQQEIWSKLSAELTEFIRKYDYRFATQGMGEEGSSPRRAIEGTVGLKDVK
jgi:hypothetical protein